MQHLRVYIVCVHFTLVCRSVLIQSAELCDKWTPRYVKLRILEPHNHVAYKVTISTDLDAKGKQQVESSQGNNKQGYTILGPHGWQSKMSDWFPINIVTHGLQYLLKVPDMKILKN